MFNKRPKMFLMEHQLIELLTIDLVLAVLECKKMENFILQKHIIYPLNPSASAVSMY